MLSRFILGCFNIIDRICCSSIEQLARLARALPKGPADHLYSLAMQSSLTEGSPDEARNFRVVLAKKRHARTTGLLNHSHIDEKSGLLLQATRLVHSFGMNFSVTIVFLDKNLRVLESDLLSPNMVRSGPRGTRAVLEIAHSYVGVSKSWRGRTFQLSNLVLSEDRSPERKPQQ